MYRLLKSVALSLALSIPVAAQWGAVTQQDDYNRFINSTSKYGLIMSTQEVVKERQDTTITSAGTASGGAHKIIAWDDRQSLYNCTNFNPQAEDPCAGSLAFAQIREATGSMMQATRGDTTLLFPVVGQAEISVGQDSVVVRNSLDGEIHHVFVKAANNYINNSQVNDIAYLDRKIYMGTASMMSVADYLTDTGLLYSTSGWYEQRGNINERNYALSNFLIGGEPIVNNDVRAVAVTRDIFGERDPFRGFGPAPWWAVGTAGGLSIFNPHKKAAYDEGTTGAVFGFVAASKRGELANGHHDGITLAGIKNSIFAAIADGYQEEGIWRNDQAGGKDLAGDPWFTTVALMEGQGSRNTSAAYFGSPQGVYRLVHSGVSGLLSTGRGQTKQLNNSTANAPIEFGNSAYAYAFDANFNDSSPMADNLTTAGSPGLISAVFGNGFSSTLNSVAYQSSMGLDVADKSFHLAFWFKSGYPSGGNPPGDVYIVRMDHGSEMIQVTMDSNGHLDFSIRDASSGTDGSLGSQDMADNQWHFVVLSKDRAANRITLYLDGEIHLVDSSLAAGGALSPDNVWIGASDAAGAGYFTGIIDDVHFGTCDDGVYPKGALPQERIVKMHSDGRAALNAPDLQDGTDVGLISNNVISVDVRDDMSGDWIVAFSDGKTAQLYNNRVLVDTFALSENLKGAAFLPDYGQDSAAVVIYGATKTRMVRPQVSLDQFASFNWQAGRPDVIKGTSLVDSSGVGNFWRGNNAIHASYGADVGHIKFANGTYGEVDADKHGQLIEGSGFGMYNPGWFKTQPGSVIYCQTGDAFDLLGMGNTVRGLSFFSKSGDCGNNHAMHISGYDNLVTDNHFMDADGLQLYLAQSQNIVKGNRFYHGDDQGLYIESNYNLVMNNIFDQMMNNAIQIASSGGDANTIIGNLTKNGSWIRIDGSAADNNIVCGNMTDGGISNSGTNTMTDCGNQTY